MTDIISIEPAQLLQLMVNEDGCYRTCVIWHMGG